MKVFRTRKLGRKKSYKVLSVIIASSLMIIMSLLFNYYINSSTPPIDSSSTWDEAPHGHPVKRSDSDVILIDNEYISWPDKLSDVEEINEYGTDWRKPDTDGDGMEDGWEVYYRKWDPQRMKWTLDPLIPDAFENPDGDGYDADHDGDISDEEALFNLREYCGGAVYDFETGCFNLTDPIFGGLSPVDNATEIAMLGGFHLFDDREYRSPYIQINPSERHFNPILASYPYSPPKYPVITSDPSEFDTDNDGMDDGWETHFHLEMKEMYFHPNGTLAVLDSIILSDLEMKMYGFLNNDHSIDDIVWNITRTPPLSPIIPWDPNIDMDIFPIHHYGPQDETIWIYRPDGLTSLEEYEYGTSPLLWDTDGDSFYDTMEEKFYDLSDNVEVLPPDYPPLR